MPGNSIRLAKLVPSDEGIDRKRPAQKGDKISECGISLEIEGYDPEDARLIFKYTDEGQSISETLEFSVRYWQSYVINQGLHTQFEHPWGAGPYCFRPIRG